MMILAEIASRMPFYALGQGLWDVVLSVCILAAVATLVVAMFSHPGKISLSPQREATPEELLAIALLTGSALAAVGEILYLIATGEFSVVILLLATTVGILLTILQLYSRASTRVRTIGKRVPYALDLIALAMGAGATFTEAVQTVVKEGGSDPFNAELRAVLAEINLGTTRRRALENLADRVPLEMLRSIIASVVQAEELGTPLAEALHSQATLMRMHRTARAEHAAAVASVRILLPSLLILMGVVLALFGPMIVNAAENGLFTQ
jgi:tight adherence protein C